MSVWGQFMKREDASSYIDKDADMPRVLRTKDFLALGVDQLLSLIYLIQMLANFSLISH